MTSIAQTFPGSCLVMSHHVLGDVLVSLQRLSSFARCICCFDECMSDKKSSPMVKREFEESAKKVWVIRHLSANSGSLAVSSVRHLSAEVPKTIVRIRQDK